MRQASSQNIAVLLSGGVDSSVALARLKHLTGYQLKAFYLKIWLEDELAFLGDCPWEEDLSYARAVCEHLNVPLEVVSLQTEYWDRVVSYTIAELRAGRTPSPDIFCNQRIKFGAFVDKLTESFDRIASGHYATVQPVYPSSSPHGGAPPHVHLLKGMDPIKDQTYFLSHMSQKQLGLCNFPLGEFSKAEVRAMAQEYGLPTKDRPDSQGICFLGKIKYNDFVKFHLGEQAGEIRDLATQKVLGEHRGYWFHTIGQRKGLGLSGGPWFVVSKDIERNIIFVEHESVNEHRAPTQFLMANPNWINDPPAPHREYTCKLRHGAHLVACHITPTGNRYKVTLTVPDRGLAPGQFCVVYNDRMCLGGGVIDGFIV